MPGKSLRVVFVAKPAEVAGLRRKLRRHLEEWGLPGLIDAAQLCVSELVTNVITHVGHGTPATLVVATNGPHLRVEVHDPDARALPTLLDAQPDEEGGRGMAVIDAVVDRWGVSLLPDRKVTWCELATGPALSKGTETSRLTISMAEVTGANAIADVLHWLRAHGCDADEVLDRAQSQFEAEIGVPGTTLLT